MDNMNEVSLQDCPICGGAGILEIEQNHWVNISCIDCGAQTADEAFNSAEEKEQAVARAVELWNLGKVVAVGPGI